MTEPAASAALWDDLIQLVRSVVAEMNRLEDLRTKTGGLVYQLGEADSIIVTKQSPPSMTITISRRPDALEVERIIGNGAESIEVRENLAAEFEASGPTFRNHTGEVLRMEETVYYLLRPFLHFSSVAEYSVGRSE